MPVEIFKTNRIYFEGLRLSVMLYRLEKSSSNFDNITLFAKTILYNFMIDASFLLIIFLSALHYLFQNDGYTVWLVCSTGVYGLNILTEIVNMYYINHSELSDEEKTQGILYQSPRYMFFNKREKAMCYKPIIKKIRKSR